jgi:hypothetical protein
VPSSAATRYRSLQQFFRWLTTRARSAARLRLTFLWVKARRNEPSVDGADPAEHRSSHRAMPQQAHVIDRIGASGHPGGQGMRPDSDP